MPGRRLSKRLIIILVVLFAIHLLPIWLFKYFPSQDGPSHIYNAYILKEYHNCEYSKLREVFKLNIALFPNWTSHLFMALLMFLLPPIVSEKILLTLCIVLMPLSLFYFLDAIDSSKVLFGLLGFLYSYHYLLQMGFYNFSLSVPLYFLTLGYWWKHKKNMSFTNIALFYVLLVTTYFCHIVSYLLLLLSLSFLAFTSYLFSVIEKTWTVEKEQSNFLTVLRIMLSKVKFLVQFTGYMLPAYFIMLFYWLGTEHALGKRKSLEQLKQSFFSIDSLVYFRDGYRVITHFLLGFLIFAFFLSVWRRIRIRKIISYKDQFLLLSICFILIYFLSPDYIGHGGWINDRVNLYVFLVLLPWFSVDYHNCLRYAIAGIMILLSIAHLTYASYDYYNLNKELSEFTSGVRLLEENSTIRVLSSDLHASDYLNSIKPVEGRERWYHLTPFEHAICYYCLNNGIAYVDNYEADYDYFPINFREEYSTEGRYSGLTDYILTWRMKKDSDEIKRLEKDYNLIHSTKHVRLYSHKKK